MSAYDADILGWSEHQAALLRRLAAGERVNDLDFPNIIEEIEAVGRSQLHSVDSHLVQALLHELKAQAWPHSTEVPHWRAEARGHRDDAQAAFAPSIAQRIDVASLYRRARRRLPDTIDGQPPLPVPEHCQVTLDDLLDEA
jgi:hypothetical protein